MPGVARSHPSPVQPSLHAHVPSSCGILIIDARNVQSQRGDVGRGVRGNGWGSARRGKVVETALWVPFIAHQADTAPLVDVAQALAVAERARLDRTGTEHAEQRDQR